MLCSSAIGLVSVIPSHSLAHLLTCSLTLSLSLSLSPTHSLTLTRSLPLTHSHTLTLSLLLSLSRTQHSLTHCFRCSLLVGLTAFPGKEVVNSLQRGWMKHQLQMDMEWKVTLGSLQKVEVEVNGCAIHQKCHSFFKRPSQVEHVRALQHPPRQGVSMAVCGRCCWHSFGLDRKYAWLLQTMTSHDT